jgi:hypothetical protein
MSISAVTQTIIAPSVAAPAAAGSANGNRFTLTSAATGPTASLSTNPITSLSSELQNVLLHQQSHHTIGGSTAGQGQTPRNPGAGTQTDAPNLPGTATPQTTV